MLEQIRKRKNENKDKKMHIENIIINNNINNPDQFQINNEIKVIKTYA
jgi:hypothetical protein